ncbi:MAG: selenium-dependent molybdenum cofactor biosynthesis protein YqeB [Desulfitobacteriaceae bacterium]
MVRVLDKEIVLVRGAGELASGIGWTLAQAGYRVVMTEVAQPLMVRWPVCFGTAVAEKSWSVEQIQALLVNGAEDCEKIWHEGAIPLIIDPELQQLREIHPEIIVDAIMAKRNIGTTRSMAPLTIGLGPGFLAGDDVDWVIETQRGHNLARLISSGTAEPNTGVPGTIGGVGRERVVYTTGAGFFHALKEIGDEVFAGEVLGEIRGAEGLNKVTAGIHGVLRGLLRDGTWIKKDIKCADIDPRGQNDYCWTISEKARAIGGAALLAVAAWRPDLGG